MKTATSLRYLVAALILVVGLVHLQQYASFISDVPTIGTLFVLNALGAGTIVAMFAFERFRALAVLGAIGLCAGSLVSIVISMTTKGLFGYTEPTLRAPMAIAIVAEILALVALAPLAASALRARRATA